MNSLDRYTKYLQRKDDSEEYWAEGAVLEFTEDLARIMGEVGISRSELADRLGTSKSYITKVFSGQANFTIDTMAKFAHALGHVVRVHLAPEESVTTYLDRPIVPLRETVVQMKARDTEVGDNVISVAPPQWFGWTSNTRGG